MLYITCHTFVHRYFYIAYYMSPLVSGCYLLLILLPRQPFSFMVFYMLKTLTIKVQLLSPFLHKVLCNNSSQSSGPLEVPDIERTKSGTWISPECVSVCYGHPAHYLQKSCIYISKSDAHNYIWVKWDRFFPSFFYWRETNHDIDFPEITELVNDEKENQNLMSWN